MNREFRIIHGATMRAKEDKPGIEGYAALFNEQYDNGWFIETIAPGAFTRALDEKQDVRALMNHDANLVLGRTKSGTLSLNEDTKGLSFSCDLPDTQTGRDLHQLVKRGDIDGCSFGFQVMKQSWREEKKDGKTTQYRNIEDVDLFDVGPVTFPAYPQTSVDARSLWPDGVPAEISERIPEIEKRAPTAPQCDCTCEECMAGDHKDCTNANCTDSNCTDCPMQMQQNSDAKVVELRSHFEGEIKKIESRLVLTQTELTEARAALAREKQSQLAWMKRMSGELSPALKQFDSAINEMARRVRIATIE